MNSLQTKVVNFSKNNIKPLFVSELKWVIHAVSIIVVVYSIVHLPFWVKNILDTLYARFIFGFLTLYSTSDNPIMSLVISAIFSILYEFIVYKHESFELVKPDTDSSPSCKDVTVEILLDVFEGDETKLKKAMYESGVPLNLHLTDENAPEIATYLINQGKTVNESCNPGSLYSLVSKNNLD